MDGDEAVDKVDYSMVLFTKYKVSICSFRKIDQALPFKDSLWLRTRAF